MKNKKLLIGILAAIVLIGLIVGAVALFGGQGSNVEPTTTEPQGTVSEADIDGITAALEYLKTVYPVGKEPTQTPRGFQRESIVRIGGVPYTVVWTVDVGEDIVKIVSNEDGIVKFEVNKNLEEDTPYKLTATITDAEGNQVSFTWDMMVPKAVDQLAIVKAAYELAEGESMNEEVTLTGIITAISTPYSADYNNISVIMVVEGGEDYPILCYRLKGEGVDDLDAGDTITVTGIIKNYKGTIEFDAGCMLIEYENTGEEFILPESIEEILKLAYSLKVGEALPVNVTLTGIVTQVNTPYDAGYDNVTVTMVVDGFGQYPIMCYRLKGDGASQIGKGDTITVTGVLKNYNGKIEYDSGCTLDSWEDTGDDVPMDYTRTAQLVKNPETGTAYKLFVKQGNLNKVLYFNGQMNGYYLGTTNNPNEAVDVYLQSYEGGYRMYFVSFGTRYYITLVSSYNASQGKTYINPELSTWSNRVWYYDGEFDTMYTTLDGNDYYLGCYNSFDTMGSSKTSYLGGSSNFPAHFGILVDKDKVVEEEEQDYSAYYKTEIVEAPKAGKPYKFGLVQKGIEGEPVIYFNGKLSNQYYLGGTEDPENAVDVTLKETKGGYYITYKDASGATQYIIMYQSTDNAGELRTNVGISDKPSTVFAYDENLKTLVATMEDGERYYIGTYKDYRTFSASNVSYIEGGSNTSFQAHLMTVTAIEGEATLEEAVVQIKKSYPNGCKDDDSLVSTFKVRDTEFEVSWKVQTTNKKAVYIKNGKLVTVPQEKPVNFRLIATITKDGESATATWELVVEQIPEDYVETLKTDVPYALGLTQKLLSGAPTLYFNGGTDSSNYRLSTTQKAANVAAVYVESAGKNAYRLYFMDGDTKTYIRVYEYTKADGNLGGSLELTTSKPKETFTYDKDLATLVYTNGDNSYFMGTYSTYTTISVSSTYYITGDKVDTIDNTQFIARFYPVPEAGEEEEDPSTNVQLGYVTKAETGKAYKLGLVQGGLDNALLMFSGTMQGYYGATTESVSEAVDVYLEKADGGYYLSFKDPYGSKQYINIVQSGTFTNFTIAADAQTVYTFDTTYNTLVTQLGGETYYIGTYGTFSTLSVSKSSYLTSSTSYPARLYAEGADTVKPEDAPAKPETPEIEDSFVEEVEEGTAYKMGLIQTMVGKALYFDGNTADKEYRLATTETFTDAVDVYMEAVSGKDNAYRLYFKDGKTKTYIRVYEYTNDEGQLRGTLELTTDKPAEYFTYDADLATVIYTNGSNSYYLGTYNTYTTLSVSSTYYITGDKANTVGVSQFPVHFYEEEVEVPETTKPAPTTPTEPPVTAPVGYQIAVADQVKAGETYKLGFAQGGLNNSLYFFSGAMKGYYGDSTQDWDAAVDVKLEKAKGGFYLSFTNASGAKQYINVVQNGTYTNFTIADSASTIYTFDAEYKTLVTTLGEEVYYMGTYNTFTTFSVSKSSYLTSSTSYPSHLYVMKEVDPDTTTKPTTAPTTAPTEPTTKPTTPSQPTNPTSGAPELAYVAFADELETGVAYKLGLAQVNNGQTLYFDGTTESESVSYRLATTTSYADAVDVYLESVSGGYLLYFMNGSTKTYIHVYHRTDGDPGYGKGSLELVITAPSAYFTFNEDAATLVYDYDGSNAYYMGTYSNYSTISVSNTSYITGDNAGNVDVSQFPARLYKTGSDVPVPTEPTTAPTEPTTPSEPTTAPTTPGSGAYVQVNSASEFTSGSYVMIVDSGYAPGMLDGAWLSAVQPVVDGNKVTDTAGAVWTLTVNGDKVVITDANGKSIAPKAANTNGIIEGSYEWTWAFADGQFTFDAVAETVRLASNSSTGQYGGLNRFRAYKLTTLSNEQYGSEYFSKFTLYKLDGEGTTEPTNPTSEPTTAPTEPTTEATEPTTASSEPTYVTEVQTGVAYKLGIDQTNKGAIYYFIGEMKGYYGASSTNWDDGVEVMLEEATGGYYVTFTDASGAKKYINVVQSGTYTNFTIADSASTVYVFDGEYNTLVTVMGSETYYMGTYNTFDTFGFSKYSYIETSFPAHLYVAGEETPDETDPVTEPTTETTEPTPSEPTYATEVQTGVAYKLGIDQTNKGAIYYFTGEMKGYYGASSTNWDDGVEVVLEEANGGYYITFTDASGAKKYINVVQSGTYTNFTIADSASTVYVFDGEYNTLVTVMGSETYYMGTYNTFDTFGFSKYSFISTSFPAHLYVIGESEPEATEPVTTEPETTEPETTEPAGSGAFEKVTDASEFTSGTYVLVVDSGYAPGVLDGTWVSAVQPTVEGDIVTDSTGAVWTLTVTDGTVILTDANGVSIGPKASNTNGIKEDSHAWTWSFENGVFTFTSADGTVRLASNATPTSGENRFRAYKLTTLNGSSASNYYSEFTLYKLDGAAAPEATEPTTEETTTAPAGSSEPEVAETVETGVVYKLGLNQVMNGKVLYFSGTTADKEYRLATTDGADSAVDVYLEAVANVEGGYRLYFMNGNTKTYIRVYEYTKSDGNLSGSLELTATEPAEYFTFDADLKTLIYTNGENSYYLGTYNTYTTISVSSTYFITGDNASKVDVSQFPAHLYVAGEGNTEATEPATTEPVTTAPVPSEPTYVTQVQTGVTYKLGIDQTNKGAIYYFSGDMTGYYGSTSTSWDDGVEVVLEAADNGYYVTFTDASGAKKYINVVQSGTYTNFTIADSASTTYTFDTEYNTLVTVLGSESYYMGTYNTYTTFGFSKYSFISTSFPAHLYVMGEGEPEATEPEATEPEATEPVTTAPVPSEPTYVTQVQTGVAYKLGIDQTNKGAIYYFSGSMSGYYGTTSTNWDNGVEVVLEAADNGYYVTFTDASGAKKYINVVQSGTYANFTIADSASTTYTFDAEYNTLVTALGSETYYMGTYNTYTTFGFSKYSFISTSFPAHLYVMGQGEPEATEPEATEPEVTEPEATEPEATEPAGSGEYVKVTDASQLTSGTYVLVVESGYALGALDGTWVLPAEPTVEGDTVTDTAGAVWTLTVTDGTVVLTDANGVSIGPKASNTNGIKEDSHAWTWSFENGVFTFTSADGTVRLASNVTPTSGENRFRAYKLTTLNGNSASNYYTEFTLYKLV